MNRQTILSVGRVSVIALSAAALAVAWSAWAPPARAAEDKRAVGEWIRKLGDASYRVRQEAQKRLIAIGEPAVKAVTEALRSEDPEVKARAEAVLKEIRRRSHQARTEAVRRGLLWARPVAGGAAGAPAICDGMAFVVGGDQKVHAVDVNTGREAWVSDQAGMFPQLQAGGGLVFAMECLGATKLFAYGARQGTVVWSRQVPSSGAVHPALSGGVVYVGDRRLLALDARTGRSKWEVPLSQPATARPAVADGAVYVACSDGKVRVLDAATGQEKWACQAFQGTSAEELAVGHGVLCVLGGSAVQAVDVKEKKELWRFPLPGGRVNFRAAVRVNGRRMKLFDSGASLRIADGMVYVARSSRVHALDARTGEKKWDYTPSQAAGPGAGVGNGVIIAGGGQVRLVGVQGVRIQAGRVILPGGWESSTPASPAVSGGVVYCPAPDSLRAVDARTGNEIWRLPTAGRPLTPAIADGVLFFGTQSGQNITTTVQGGVVIVRGPQGGRPPRDEKATKGAATRKAPGLFAVRLPPAKGRQTRQ